MSAYYNEFEPYAAQWLRNLIKAGLIPNGEVDDRSIRDVSPDDLRGFTQCHFFAGLGGWGRALRLAGWPDDREIWTGSPPCQPFSVAGKRAGTADDRHLWPDLFRLIRSRRPAVLMGEQVSAAIGMGWVDGVNADLEGEGYASRFVSVPACAVNAAHRRDRLWFVADRADNGLERVEAPAKPTGRNDPQHDGGPSMANPASHDERQQSAGWETRDRNTGSDNFSSLGNASREGLQVSERETFCGTWRREEGRSTGESSGPLGSIPNAHSTERRSSEPAGDFADSNDAGREEKTSGPGASGEGLISDSDKSSEGEGREQRSGEFGGSCDDSQYRNFWHDCEWINGADGKARRVKPRVCGVVDGLSEGVVGLRTIDLLAKNVPARVGKLRALGNAIVPQVAAEVIKAYMECKP